MNKLKDHCKNGGYKYFLTYADNNAIGYFKKQGFHKNLKMPVEQWKDYIKDYDGGTLMEAEIDSKIDYSNLSEILKDQRNCIVKYCKKFLNVKRKYTYKDFEDEIKNKGINLNIPECKNESKNDSEAIAEDIFNCIPGLKDSGWTYNDYKIQCEKEKLGDNVNFLTQCRNIISKLKSHDNARPFLQPVQEKDAPDYYKIIKEPMDLETLEKGLEIGKYKNKSVFLKDLKKIFSNARAYNKPISYCYKFANNLELFIEEDLKKLKDC